MAKLATVDSGSDAGQRAVQDALYKLGQQLEDSQAELAALRDTSAAAEKEVSGLAVRRASAATAAATADAEAARLRKLGVPEAGVDAALDAVMQAQAALDSARAAGDAAVADAARARDDAAADDEEALADLRREKAALAKAVAWMEKAAQQPPPPPPSPLPPLPTPGPRVNATAQVAALDRLFDALHGKLRDALQGGPESSKLRRRRRRRHRAEPTEDVVVSTRVVALDGNGARSPDTVLLPGALEAEGGAAPTRKEGLMS